MSGALLAGMIEILTIGHSNHGIEGFLRILAKHGVRLLVDLRSEPHSRYAPQYNRVSLQRSLESAGIDYRYSGASLGGRPKDPALLAPDGKPDYDKIAASEPFQAELRAIVDLAGRMRLCLMCSEADPMCCHRESVVGRALRSWGVEVTHLSPDGMSHGAGGSKPRIESQ